MRRVGLGAHTLARGAGAAATERTNLPTDAHVEERVGPATKLTPREAVIGCGGP